MPWYIEIEKIKGHSLPTDALGSISRLNDIQLKIQATVPTIPHEFENKFRTTGNHLLMTWGKLLVFCIVSIFVGNTLLHRVSKDTRE